MKLEVGAARLMLDGSGEASVTVIPSGGRKRQVRVSRSMAAAASSLSLWRSSLTEEILLTSKAGVPFAFPGVWSPVGDEDVVSQILDKADQVMSDQKMHASVAKAIRKRKERERRERVSNHATRVRSAVKEMLKSGGTPDEIMAAVQETLVASIQEG